MLVVLLTLCLNFIITLTYIIKTAFIPNNFITVVEYFLPKIKFDFMRSISRRINKTAS